MGKIYSFVAGAVVREHSVGSEIETQIGEIKNDIHIFPSMQSHMPNVEFCQNCEPQPLHP